MGEHRDIGAEKDKAILRLHDAPAHINQIGGRVQHGKR